MREAYQYYRSYKDLEVTVPAEYWGGTGRKTVTVHITNYQNTGSSTPGNMTPGNIDEKAHSAVKSLLEAYRKTPYDPKRPWDFFLLPDDVNEIDSPSNTFYNVHHGKGSVEGIRWVLQLVAWKNRPDASGKPQWKDKAAAEQTLQNYCDQKIGLDCNGLVVNCVNHIFYRGLTPAQVSNTSTLAFTKPAYLRNNVLANGGKPGVSANDVITYVQYIVHDNPKTPNNDETVKDSVDGDTSHVCMIDQVLSASGASAELKIVESAGHFGPRENTETVRLIETGIKGKRGGNIFKLMRQPVPGWSLPNETAYVYVSEPKL